MNSHATRLVDTILSCQRSNSPQWCGGPGASVGWGRHFPELGLRLSLRQNFRSIASADIEPSMSAPSTTRSRSAPLELAMPLNSPGPLGQQWSKFRRGASGRRPIWELRMIFKRAAGPARAGPAAVIVLCDWPRPGPGLRRLGPGAAGTSGRWHQWPSYHRDYSH